jgi:glucokinase
MGDLLVGIDIGGSKIATSAGDAAGNLLSRSRRPTDCSGDPRQDVLALTRDVRRVVDEAGGALQDVACVGVSAPGPVDPSGSRLLDPPNLLGWRDVPLRRWLEEELGTAVRLENDANAAALAEWRFGAGQGFQDLVYLTMSTGVGAGLILEGRLYRGVGRGAGEVGHARVCWDADAALCSCGARGCLEAYVGGASWRRYLAERPGSTQAATPESIVAAARRGDRQALEEMGRFNHYLARGIVNLGFTLAPQAVILGTIAVAAGEALCFEPVRQQVREGLWAVLAEELVIRPASLGDELPYRAGLGVALEPPAAAGRG